MNENTLIVVCCYAGDRHQVKNFMPLYLHHECPVLILSPEDAPVTAENLVAHPQVSYRSAGRRDYNTPLALARMKLHLQILLEQPQEFFLIEDSDCVCLSPKLPRYPYWTRDQIWSSIISDSMHKRPESYKLPRIAFHPPLFLSRALVAKLVEVWDSCPPDPQTPFIDHHIMQLAVKHDIPYATFENADSLPAWGLDGHYTNEMSKAVRKGGRIFVHSVKEPEVMLRLMSDYQYYRRTNI